MRFVEPGFIWFSNKNDNILVVQSWMGLKYEKWFSHKFCIIERLIFTFFYFMLF